MKIDLRPERRVLRQFAWASLVMFPVIAGYLAWRHGLPLGWTIGLCAVGVVIAVVQFVLVPLAGELVGAVLEKAIPRTAYQVLTVVAAPIGFVLSHVVMGAIYYLVITPIGLVFRATGRDVLGIRRGGNETSFWHDRGRPRSPASYFKLY